MKKFLLGIGLSVCSLFAGAANLTDFGAVCDGVSDVTAAFDNAVAAAMRSGKDREIHLPTGACVFYHQPKPIGHGVSILGQGKSATRLHRHYNGTFLTLIENGVRIEQLTIYADQGTSGGVGIRMWVDNSGPGGNHMISHVWITGQGTWDIALGAWGHERTIPPIGIRTVGLYDVSVFNATYQAVVLWGCEACEWFGGGAYQGFGTTQQVVVGPGTNNRIDALYDKSTAILYPGSMREP